VLGLGDWVFLVFFCVLCWVFCFFSRRFFADDLSPDLFIPSTEGKTCSVSMMSPVLSHLEERRGRPPLLF